VNDLTGKLIGEKEEKGKANGGEKGFKLDRRNLEKFLDYITEKGRRMIQ